MNELIPLDASTDISLVGVKAARLAAIAKSNISIPIGFVVPINMPIVDGLSNTVQAHLNDLDAASIILRISAPDDNTTITSAITDINPDNILDTIKQAQIANFGSAIIIQKHLDAEIWGASYSTNPHTKAKNEIYITSSMFSIADSNPADVLLLHKATGSVIAEQEIPETNLLTEDHIKNIHTTTIEIERIFKQPIRIKFGFDTGKLFIIGVKPL